jgi:ppGpp synthetase/RelA/SpoT-type nucleotidyltranferase
MEIPLQHILIIDPKHKSYIRALSLSARNVGFAVTACVTIQEGLKILKESTEKIESVLLSSVFSNALTGIKQVDQFLPVIMLLADRSACEVSIGAESLKNGAYNFISKADFDVAVLFGILNGAVSLYREARKAFRYDDLKAAYQERRPLYEQMLQTSQMLLHNRLRGQLMFPPSGESRVKEFSSLYDKLLQKEKIEGPVANPFARFTDIAGLRLVFFNADDMQKASTLISESDDFIDARRNGRPKPDDRLTRGYRAIHFDLMINPDKRCGLEEYKQLTGVPCEVQLKTIFAHAWSKVHHLLVYKNQSTSRISSVEFDNAAIRLESIEEQITHLCRLYHTNGN